MLVEVEEELILQRDLEDQVLVEVEHKELQLDLMHHLLIEVVVEVVEVQRQVLDVMVEVVDLQE
jgi:hypothetical protein